MTRHDNPDLPGAGSPQDITDPATGGSRLLSARCSTCILRGPVTRCTWARRGCGRSPATRWQPAPSSSATTP